MADQEGKKGSFLGNAAKWFIVIVIIALVIAYFICNYTYSDGNRAGVIIKFSRKGFIFKTYEGELNIGGMGNIPGTAQMNQVWDFSVRDQAIAS